jgi:hypothetical protein
MSLFSALVAEMRLYGVLCLRAKEGSINRRVLIFDLSTTWLSSFDVITLHARLRKSYFAETDADILHPLSFIGRLLRAASL